MAFADVFENGVTLLVTIRSAGTETLRANSALDCVDDNVTRDFRCLLKIYGFN